LLLVSIGGALACGSNASPAQTTSTPATTTPSTPVTAAGTLATGARAGTPAVSTAGSGSPSVVAPAAIAGRGAAGTGSVPPVAASAGAGVPCSISEKLVAGCGGCHGAVPQNGAPMPLVTYADYHAPARTNPSRKVYELVAERVEDRARPMPPDPTKRLSDAAIAEIKAWAAGGAVAGAACSNPTTSVGAAGQGAAGAPAAGSGSPTSGAAGAGGVADIEECFELRAHGQPTTGDKSKYPVIPGESYTSFFFKAPWTKPVQGLRFKHLPDNSAVLHHWLLFSESGGGQDGDVETCDLGGPTGFLCGAATTRSLITGWAPGRPDFVLPPDVGLELPAPGAMMVVELHYYNKAGGMAQDGSGVEICVTSKFRKNTASISWLGTETIELPPMATSTSAGTCTPQRAGMNATDPINILYSWPHMHKLGTHMKSVVNRAGGAKETLYDGDFSFEFQVVHDTPLKLMPGDTITTTCTFNNTTPGHVSFGQSTNMEMCFNFAYAWPAHALDHPGGAIGSSPNSCLH